MKIYGYLRKGFPYKETDQLAKVIAYDCNQLFWEEWSLIVTNELETVLEHIQTGNQLRAASLKIFAPPPPPLQLLRFIISLLKEKEIQLISSEIDFECKSKRINQQTIQARGRGKIVIQAWMRYLQLVSRL